MADNASASPAPSGAAPPERAEDAVLGTVLLNQRALRQGPEEDPDLALAKMLQAQEQAWLAMAGGSGALENLPLAGGGSSEPAALESSGAGDAAGEGEELTDEEMARRLQEEEEREFQARLLALAGVRPASGGGGSVAGGEGGGGEDAAAQQAGQEYLTEDEVDPDELTYEELTALGEAVGTVSRGIAQADIDALPTAQYYEVAGTAGAGPAGESKAEAEEQCPICRVEFEPEDTVKVLPLCRHYYHPECITEWLKRNKVCCICTKEVLEEGKKGGCVAAGAAAADASSGDGAVLGERRRQ